MDSRELTSALPALPCACATLRRASRAVTQLYDHELRKTGLRVTQFTLLEMLERAGELTQGSLGDRLALDSSTLSRTLLLIEKQGWIRSAPGVDLRERHLRLTTKGRTKLEQARVHWKRAQDRLREALGEAEWNRLFASLDGLTKAVQ
jgi:DNA-binding MarR family transcriptional regulator